MRAPAAALLVAAVLSWPAHAYLKAGPAGYGHWLQGAIAPLDGAGAFATPAAAYSMRRLKSSYAGPAIRLRRASDNAEADIGFLGFTGFTGAPIDTAAANAHCAATSCFVATWYDQSGNSRPLTQAAASQPSVFFNCIQGLPCARTAAAAKNLLFGIGSSPTTLTLNGVGRQTTRTAPGGYTSCTFAGAYPNRLFQHADFDVLVATSGVVDISATATAGQFHSHMGVYAAAGGVARIDAVETAGGANAPGALTNIYFGGEDASTCDYSEVVQWFNYAMPAAERAALHANQKSFWGF